MADPYAAAMIVLFNGPGSDAAIYTPVAAPPYDDPVRVILSQPDRITDLSQGRIVQGENELSFLMSEVPDPTEGDMVEVIRDGVTYRTFTLIGEPFSDVERLSWKIGGQEV
jgi:hypothetical protein